MELPLPLNDPSSGVDLIWKDDPDVQQEPYTLEAALRAHPGEQSEMKFGTVLFVEDEPFSMDSLCCGVKDGFDFARLHQIPTSKSKIAKRESLLKFSCQVSPTSDINPPSPPDWKEGYAEFKHTKVGRQLVGTGM